ncbi:DUF3156 family protein [uncultured Aquitalea sp.]|uniref:DUF3156 family protein n=1 Tax=uncultured Aquitalea sp. TaxID=540272 RepID=UPI0025F2D903|nr:DUF3156 family protein [uncultured Aquitalea sp.]
MRPRWVERLARAAPRGYRPGATLRRLRLELRGVACEEVSGTRLDCRTDDGLAFTVCERTEAVFLAHTVCCEFRLPLPLACAGEGRIVIRHRGMLRREGLICQAQGADMGELAALARRLQQDHALQEALLPLDFRCCELRVEDGCWQLCIEHFAASEVVTSLPPMRRYLRLLDEQRLALLAAFRACGRLAA